MADPRHVTQVLQAASEGDPRAAEELLPLVYNELRNLAHHRMARLSPGQTIQPTELVHEVYIRLIDAGGNDWNTRGHFFGAAAQAMRQILVDQARRKFSLKRGGKQLRVDADEVDLAIDAPSEDVLALDIALGKLETEDPRKAQIVMYRYFAGLDREETSAAMGLSLRTIDREWRYIRARLHKELKG